MNRGCKVFFVAVAVAGAALSSGLAGCSDSRNAPSEERDIGFSISASNNEIVAGEMVTLTARSSNTLGRDAHVKWTSTAGSLKTEQDGRIARVSFDNPGTYTVTGRLEMDGRVVREDSVNVRVRAVP